MKGLMGLIESSKWILKESIRQDRKGEKERLRGAFCDAPAEFLQS